VVQDVFVVATSVLKSIGEDRHSIKGFLLVDAVGECKDSGSEPERVKRNSAEGERTNDAAKKVCWRGSAQQLSRKSS
jgi:hypothetical protein